MVVRVLHEARVMSLAKKKILFLFDERKRKIKDDQLYGDIWLCIPLYRLILYQNTKRSDLK